MPVAILLSAVLGIAMQLRFGEWVDIPPEIIGLMHNINGSNVLLAIVATFFFSSAQLKKFPRVIRVLMRIQAQHAIWLCIIAVGNFSTLAFYEHFPFGVVAAMAFFPIFWFGWLLITSIFTS